jgi:hypothetical protein
MELSLNNIELCCDVYREGSIADEKLIGHESMEFVPSSDLMLDDMLHELLNFAFPGQPLVPPSQNARTLRYKLTIQPTQCSMISTQLISKKLGFT